MKVEIGQTVYVPGPDGNPVRGTMIARGEPGDAVEMNIDGLAVQLDVALSATKRRVTGLYCLRPLRRSQNQRRRGAVSISTGTRLPDRRS